MTQDPFALPVGPERASNGRVRPVPISLNQERRLAFEEAFAASPQRPARFHSVLGLCARGPADLGAMTSAFNALIRKHDSLRAAFRAAPERTDRDRSRRIAAMMETGLCAPGFYTQHIVADAAMTVSVRTCADSDYGSRNQRLAEIARDLGEPPFDYGTAPLMRAALVKFTEADAVLLVIVSHLICDRWSVSVLARDFRYFYRAACGLPAGESAPVRLTYADVLRWQSGTEADGRRDRSVEYWRTRWTDLWSSQIDRTDIPFALPRLGSRSPGGGQERLRLDQATAAELSASARRCQVTPFVLFVAALARLLSQSLNRDRVVIWSNFDNRALPGAEHVVAWMVNSHALGVDLRDDPSPPALLARVRETVLDAMEHQHVSLAEVWHRSGESLERGVRIALDVFERPRADASGAFGADDSGWRRASVPGFVGPTADLQFNVEIGAQMVIVAHYSKDLLVAHAVRQLLARLVDCAKALAGSPDDAAGLAG
jgi:hypothetical protein